MIRDELRNQAMQQLQGAGALGIAFIGIVNKVFDAIDAHPGSAASIAERTGLDAGYLRRWCDAAYAFGYLEAEGDTFRLAELGQAFRPSTPGTLMPMAVQAVLGAHMVERAAGLFKSGERPGESVLAERATILPWFGPMLESGFGPLFAREILPNVPAFRALEERGGLAVDLGCGNGWYLRRLAAAHPQVRGIGLDGFAENIRQADELAFAEGLGARLSFRAGDLDHYTVEEPADLVAMNRALHHVWDRKERVFATLRDHLRPGGHAVIWEPRWPADRAALRTPRGRALAFQNLSEHVQGNHFLQPDEIEAAFRGVGMRAETFLFADGAEAVVVGTREG